jgi:integrase
MVTINKLTTAAVVRISEPGRYSDGRGLYLQVKERNDVLRKSWLLLFKRNGAKWSQMLGLGPFPSVSVAKAREKAQAARHLILDGINPIAEKKRLRAEASDAALALKADAARRVSFREATARYLRDNVHDAQWERSLATHAFPHIGDLPVSAIEPVHIIELLRAGNFWATKTVTARRVRQRIEAVIGHATVNGLRSGANPAAWRGGIEMAFKSDKGLTKVEAHAALPYKALPGLMQRLRATPGVVARALEFAVLCASRSGEVRGADWSEIDLVAKTWTIGAGRMKAQNPHTVPLSDRAVAILLELKPTGTGTGLIFRGVRGGGVMKSDSLRKVLHDLVGSAEVASVHGMRSGFATWAAENATGIPSEAVEQSLAHTIGTRVSRAYDRSKRLELRARLMQRWADFCAGKHVDDENNDKVTPLRRSA